MGKVVVLLGSNIDPATNIRLGARLLSEKVSIIYSSSVWITPAEGTSGPDFFNAAVLCVTPMTEEAMKTNILRPLETQLGRVRTHDKFAPRTIDLDVIIEDDKILDTRLWNTAFILLPIAEIVSDLRDPSNGKSIQELADAMEPISGARKKKGFPLFK